MILIGLIQALYSVTSGLFSGLGVDFTLPPRISEVWQYMIGVLQQGKSIIALFLDLPYLQSLLTFVFVGWSILITLELISFVIQLIKLNI